LKNRSSLFCQSAKEKQITSQEFQDLGNETQGEPVRREKGENVRRRIGWETVLREFGDNPQGVVCQFFKRLTQKKMKEATGLNVRKNRRGSEGKSSELSRCKKEPTASSLYKGSKGS